MVKGFELQYFQPIQTLSVTNQASSSVRSKVNTPRTLSPLYLLIKASLSSSDGRSRLVVGGGVRGPVEGGGSVLDGCLMIPSASRMSRERYSKTISASGASPIRFPLINEPGECCGCAKSIEDEHWISKSLRDRRIADTDLSCVSACPFSPRELQPAWHRWSSPW